MRVSDEFRCDNNSADSACRISKRSEPTSIRSITPKDKFHICQCNARAKQAIGRCQHVIDAEDKGGKCEEHPFRSLVLASRPGRYRPTLAIRSFDSSSARLRTVATGARRGVFTLPPQHR